MENNKGESIRSFVNRTIKEIEKSIKSGKLNTEETIFLTGILESSFDKGSKRVLTKTGGKINIPKIMNKGALVALVNDQQKYISNLTRDARRTVRKSLTD